MPTSVNSKESKGLRTRRGIRRGTGTPADMRKLLKQRDCLYEAARRDPESEAADLARTFLFTGMLAGLRGGAGATPEVARLEQLARDQRMQLDEIARTAKEAQEHKLDARDVCRRIAEIVGLAPPSPAAFEQMFHPEQVKQGEEQTCPTQNAIQNNTSTPPRSR